MWRQHTRHAHIRDTTRHITKTTKSISILDNVHSFRVRIVRSNHSSWQMKIICQTMGVKMCDYSWIDHAIVSAPCDTCTLLKTQCLSTSLAAWNNNKKNKQNELYRVNMICLWHTYDTFWPISMNCSITKAFLVLTYLLTGTSQVKNIDEW